MVAPRLGSLAMSAFYRIRKPIEPILCGYTYVFIMLAGALTVIQDFNRS